ncbi:MAG: sulfite exporter TauE/SafE family protein [bacterium]
MAEIIELFLIGFTSSFSSCLIFCSPLIVGYIGTTRKGWSSGVKGASLILAFRLAGFIILGLLASLVGRLLLAWLMGAQRILFALGGALIISLGVLIIVSQEPRNPFCKTIDKIRRISTPGDLIVLGLLMAFLPCAPHLVLLGFVALSQVSIFQGMALAGAFGVGTSISPLILGAVSGELSQITFSKGWIGMGFRIFCGGLIIAVGLQLLAGVLW